MISIFIIDTAASHHVILHTLREKERKAKSITVNGVGGEVKGLATTKHELLGDCLVIRSSPFNLISWYRLKRAGFHINTEKDKQGNDTFIVEKMGICYLSFTLIKEYGI